MIHWTGLFPVYSQRFDLLNTFLYRGSNGSGDLTAAPSISSPSVLFLLILLSIVFRDPFDKTSHLSLLSSRPQVLPDKVEISKASFSSGSVPAIIPSSRYQQWWERLGIFDSISSIISHRVSENNRGPKGSPGCTPD